MLSAIADTNPWLAAFDLAKAFGINGAFSNQGSGSAVGSIFAGLGSLFGGGGTSAASAGSSYLNDLTGHATGGSWKVGGSGGTDSQLVAFKASPMKPYPLRLPAKPLLVRSISRLSTTSGAA